MMFRVYAFEPVERDMGINLRSRNIRVSEDGLNRAKIGTVLDHVRGARVPQHVRAGMASGSETRFADELPEALAGQPAAPCTHKQQGRKLRSC